MSCSQRFLASGVMTGPTSASGSKPPFTCIVHTHTHINNIAMNPQASGVMTGPTSASVSKPPFTCIVHTHTHTHDNNIGMTLGLWCDDWAHICIRLKSTIDLRTTQICVCNMTATVGASVKHASKPPGFKLQVSALQVHTSCTEVTCRDMTPQHVSLSQDRTLVLPYTPQLHQ